MCGIFGISIKEESKIDKSQFSNLLKNLFIYSESRGKEASGFAFSNNTEIKVFKTKHPASHLIKSKEFENNLDWLLESNSFKTAIGHSRLVTNGNEELNINNQPVIKNGMVGIHNGIVVNVDELWKKYSDIKRTSELDSEVILALLKRNLINQDILEARNKTFDDIYGMTNVAVLFENYQNLLISTNNGSLYYYSDNDIFIFASEAFILKNVVIEYSENPEILHVEPGKTILLNLLNLSDNTQNISNGIIKQITDLTNSKSDIVFKKETQIFIVKNSFFEEFDKNAARVSLLKRCEKTILPQTFPFIEFDENGISNFANNYREQNLQGKEQLLEFVEPYRKSNGKPDCLVAFSGGRDSSYGLHYIKEELGLNPIAYSYDWGMITDLARRNQARLCGKLGVEHILISADIRKKRENIRKNVSAWLKRPHLGTVPLFMAGDKQYFYWANELMKQNNIKLAFLCENMLETTNFKSGFCGIKPVFDKDHTYSLSIKNKFKMLSFYGKEFLLNPGYLNSSMLDTLDAFKSYYVMDHQFVNLYNYILWEENQVDKILLGHYDWEIAEDTETTWRIGDGTAPFYNYIYYTVAGFSENDTFRSNQIMENMISRKEALRLAERDNKPRFESIKWYCDTIGIDFESTINRINQIKKLY